MAEPEYKRVLERAQHLEVFTEGGERELLLREFTKIDPVAAYDYTGRWCPYCDRNDEPNRGHAYDCLWVRARKLLGVV